MTDATITGVKQETHDVRTFRLEPEESIEFLPGQYCIVSIKEPEKELEKDGIPLTFASPPTRDYIELTVKKIGSYTSALHELEEGDKVELGEPKGESLVFDKSIDREVVFIAGGSGITPFISAIRYSADMELENSMTLIYSNMEYRDIIFRTELEHLAKEYEKFSVVNTLTENSNDHWGGETGFVDREMVEKHVENPEEKLWYICGPPGMIDAMEKMLEDIGVSEKLIRYEKWQIPGKHD